jgi:hypothetical protein
MAQHNSSEKPLFDNGMCGQFLDGVGVDSKESQNITASGKKVTDEEMIDLMEDTLEKQRQGNAVHDEESDEEPELEEVEDFDESIHQRLSRIEDNMNWGDPEPEVHDDVGYGYDNNLITRSQNTTFEEQTDPRWFRDEYVLLNEDVDWDKIEGDPKLLFTSGNSKVALDTIIFNLQPARFCPSLANGMCQIVQADEKTGEFKIACYAYQDERQYDVALQLRLRQMRFWDTHSAEEIYKKLEEYYYDKKIRGKSLTYALTRAKRDAKHGKPAVPARHAGFKSVKLKYIRFNQSGDLKDRDDAIKMDKIAELAEKNLGLISYTYTARKDVLAQHKFQYVHVQGSGFSAITGINKAVGGDRGKKSIGKTFRAFPSLFNKKHKLQERDPKYKGLYYEDIFEKLTPEGQPNPKYDKYSKINPSGWYPCPGDCNSCPACKMDKFKNIAVKIHRAYQRIAGEWHDVEQVGAKGYRVHQGFDPYEKDEKGKPIKWSQEMEKEYEGRVEKLRKQKEFSKLSKTEKEKTAKETLEQYYKIFDPEMSDLEDWKKKVKKWEDKIKKHKLEVPFAKMRKDYGVPENRVINKLTKEDIDKYATEEEKEFLNEIAGIPWSPFSSTSDEAGVDSIKIDWEERAKEGRKRLKAYLEREKAWKEEKKRRKMNKNDNRRTNR